MGKIYITKWLVDDWLRFLLKIVVRQGFELLGYCHFFWGGLVK